MKNYSTEYTRVTFMKPFVLKGLEGLQPSGTYSVEKRKEKGGYFAFLKDFKSSTWIRTYQNYGEYGQLRLNEIDPSELSKALEIDAFN